MWLLSFISYVANTSVIVLSFVNKLPQILAILRAKNAKGLSSLSSVLILVCYTTMSSYGFANGFALKNYVESVFLAVQEIILLSLVLFYQQTRHLKLLILAIIIYVTFVIGILMAIVPMRLLELMLMLTMPIGSWSKVLQIWKIYDEGHPGQVSAATWSVSAYGCLVRVVTSIFETQNRLLLATYFLALTLNTTIVVETLYYRRYPKISKRVE
ncbi:mannose-P-dolichol utilization defect 1 protein homolog [Corticium candelabrum]|uniref:mannose-P-dolichol utilization defect 1 protein homolog n=1 Tax=Corticium candelabrum TaxID=121492 RepID=UPI002E25AB72|nr:mannose-P-dolichol utilization defect 1 protein homolog [Corticium candelabrum]